MKKSDKTTAYILEQVSPVFNRKGYSATSMSDLTQATGLTKGAIYGNFKNKEDLALKAFTRNSKWVLSALGSQIRAEKRARNQLLAMTQFYRTYYKRTLDFGGCPILNVGIDANHQNKALFEKVNLIIDRLYADLETILKTGKNNKEFRSDLDCSKYARLLFSMIEGAVFLAMTKKNGLYISEMMDQIDKMIDQEIMN